MTSQQVVVYKLISQLLKNFEEILRHKGTDGVSAQRIAEIVINDGDLRSVLASLSCTIST